MTIRRHFWIRGRVQGVGFRANAAAQMRVLGLTGWARNLVDGRLEAVVEGDKRAVDAFQHWSHEGPDAARVDEVVVADEVPQGLSNVEIW